MIAIRNNRRAALFILLVVVPGCRESFPVGSGSVQSQSNVLGISIWEPAGIDPGLSAEESGITIAMALFEGLLAPSAGNGPPRPGVAKSFERSSDGLSWTFLLNEDAKWSNGAPVTAHDFVAGWRRAVDPALGSRASAQMAIIAGAKDIQEGRAEPSSLGVTAVDDLTLRVDLAWPDPGFASRLTYPVFFPVPTEVIERHGSKWTRPENIVSNGPFLLKAFRPGDQANLVRNPAWRSAKSVKLDGVDFHFITSERLAYDWFMSGKIHWMKGGVARERIPELRRKKAESFRIEPVLCTGYVALNTRKPPFDDPRVRRAFDLGMDKEKLVGEVLLGGQEPAWGFVPTAIFDETGYQPIRDGDFDPVKGRKLLAEVIRERGPLPPIAYLVNTGEGNRVVGEFLQAQWAANLGVEVAIVTTEFKTLLSQVHRGDFTMARASWCADFVDPANFLEVLASDSPNNYPGFADSGYDSALARARTAVDIDERNRLLQEAERVLVQAKPLIPLYFFTRVYLLSPRVQGFEHNLLDVHPLDLIELETL